MDKTLNQEGVKTLPSTGSISMAQVATELDINATGINLNMAAVRDLAGAGGSGTVISMSQLRGKSSDPTLKATHIMTVGDVGGNLGFHAAMGRGSMVPPYLPDEGGNITEVFTSKHGNPNAYIYIMPLASYPPTPRIEFGILLGDEWLVFNTNMVSSNPVPQYILRPEVGDKIRAVGVGGKLYLQIRPLGPAKEDTL